MLDFFDALKVVDEYEHVFDYCTEYSDAFVFSKMDSMTFGGGESPAVVLKESGECINFVAYITMGHSEAIREGYIRDWKDGKVK